MSSLEEFSWTDIDPIAQNDGLEPLAPISYSEEYSKASAYLRAVIRAKEQSERVLALTKDIIMMNPAHYTVWAYRASTLLTLNSDLYEELLWIESVAETFSKNYQVWHHRQIIMSAYCVSMDAAALKKIVTQEKEFIYSMLDKDTKNYHAWAYRQWVVKKFEAWDGEPEYTNEMIVDDVKNNSAWNHRYFALFSTAEDDDALIEEEILFAKDQILLAPQNFSSWNYLRGVMKRGKRDIIELEEFCSSLVTLPVDGEETIIRSSCALEYLGDIYASKHDDRALTAFSLLADQFDTIRQGYWNYKKALYK